MLCMLFIICLFPVPESRALPTFFPVFLCNRGRTTLPQHPTLPAVSLVCFCCLARSLCSTTESPWLLNPYLVHINPQGRGGVRRRQTVGKRHRDHFHALAAGHSSPSTGCDLESPWKHSSGVSVCKTVSRKVEGNREDPA